MAEAEAPLARVSRPSAEGRFARGCRARAERDGGDARGADVGAEGDGEVAGGFRAAARGEGGRAVASRGDAEAHRAEARRGGGRAEGDGGVAGGEAADTRREAEVSNRARGVAAERDRALAGGGHPDGIRRRARGAPPLERGAAESGVEPAHALRGDGGVRQRRLERLERRAHVLERLETRRRREILERGGARRRRQSQNERRESRGARAANHGDARRPSDPRAARRIRLDERRASGVSTNTGTTSVRLRDVQLVSPTNFVARSASRFNLRHPRARPA